MYAFKNMYSNACISIYIYNQTLISVFRYEDKVKEFTLLLSVVLILVIITYVVILFIARIIHKFLSYLLLQYAMIIKFI